jgi:hypothetical protein
VSTAIAERSKGMFLWLEYKMKDLKAKADKGELNVQEVSKMPEGIMGIYKEYFERLYKEVGADNYSRALAVGLLAPRSPLPEKIWMRALGFSEATKENRDAYKTFKDKLSSLLVFDDSLMVLRAPHKSMVDFITSSPASGEGVLQNAESQGFDHLAVEASPQQHALIAKVLNEAFEDAEKIRQAWVMGSFNKEDDYALANIVYHLCLSGDPARAVSWYLEMHRLIRRVDKAARDGDVRTIIEEGRQRWCC